MYLGVIPDNFMLLVDKAQRRIFKVSLSDFNHSYAAVETSNMFIKYPFLLFYLCFIIFLITNMN